MDGRACTTFKRFVTGFAELLDFPSLIITVLIGLPDSMAFVVNGIAIITVKPSRLIRPAPEVRAM
jgi:hypothetical protein